MKRIAAAQFKAQCLRVMEQVRTTREPVLITKRGQPLAKLVPADKVSDDFIVRLEGTFKIVGDIESPIISWDEWDPLR